MAGVGTVDVTRRARGCSVELLPRAENAENEGSSPLVNIGKPATATLEDNGRCWSDL